MADNFGLVQIPVATSPQGEAAGDPVLTKLVTFLAALLNENGSKAWGEVAPGAPLVRTVFTHDPEDIVFNERQLPALFLWRASQVEDQIADDIFLDTTQCSLLWVFPPAPQETQRRRETFANAVTKLVLVAFERGRTPSYVFDGDLDATAATLGSLVYAQANANVWSVSLKKGRRHKFVERIEDGAPRSYYALEMTLELQENLELGLDDFDTPPGADADVKNVDGTSVVHNQF